MLGVSPIPSQLVGHAGDIVFAAVGCAGAFDQDQAARPQHGLVGITVNLTLRRDEPAGLIPYRLRYGVQLGGITGDVLGALCEIATVTSLLITAIGPK